ncbi:MAG: hypothetical protein QM774_03650 [Gordonia sp. (in: high G+C Gram-positive bacteria)]|uniref:hypothetical protein n=1 Tax=Gordonia sp. (in: high G+C Gram-positive bacteria) TaxID=84139 RepID=UPI0039E2A0D5
MVDQLQVLAGDECECLCHRNPSVQHVVACCGQCDDCRTRVRRDALETHPARCAGFRMGRLALRVDANVCIVAGIALIVAGFVHPIAPLGWHSGIGIFSILFGAALLWAPSRYPVRGLLAGVIALGIVTVVALVILAIAASSTPLVVVASVGAAVVAALAIWERIALRKTQGDVLLAD